MFPTARPGWVCRASVFWVCWVSSPGRVSERRVSVHDPRFCVLLVLIAWTNMCVMGSRHAAGQAGGDGLPAAPDVSLDGGWTHLDIALGSDGTCVRAQDGPPL